MNKFCRHCNQEKDISLFNRNCKAKDGHLTKCKECEKQYRTDNTINIKNRAKQYNISNKERIRIQKQQYYNENKEKILKRNRKWQIENKEIENLRHRNWRKNNHILALQKDKDHRTKNKNKINEYQREYRKNNLEKVRKYHLNHYHKNKHKLFEYNRKRYRLDPQANIRMKLSSRIRDLLSNLNRKNGKKTIYFLGCSFEDLINHFKTLFYSRSILDKKMMDLNDLCSPNVEIDHIIPCFKFDLTKEEEQLRCFHWSNLQPLWKEDHMIKSQKDVAEFYEIRRCKENTSNNSLPFSPFSM